MYNEIKKVVKLNDGREIEISTGKLAKQATGSVVVKMGKTMLLATVVAADEAKEDVDFMPLSVEYKEKYAAVGRFPGGFLKREGKPSDYEILVSRLVDRALRPLFPDDYHAEVFVNIMLMSADPDDMPDALAGLAASAAMSVTDIPFSGPISEVRVSRINGKLVINPTFSQNKDADIDMIVAGTIDNIVMVEGELNEVSEEEMIEAIKFAHEAIQDQCRVQLELREACGITGFAEYCHEVNDEDLRKKVWDECFDKVYKVAMSKTADKHLRKKMFQEVKEEFLSQYDEENLESVKKFVDRYFHDVEKEAVRQMVLNEKFRLDGRKYDEIRPIWCEVDYLPMAHGSALFTRGETQSLTTVTLGGKLDEQMLDGVMIQRFESFVLHYNFPPFSTGDAKPYRGVGRREIGHGNLAHRAISKVIPPKGEKFPYTVRVVSDILESNGSSSMATVCAGTLALMDAGVPISRPVSGIAMGLIYDPKTGKFAVLSDILGDEDHLGDMDFKVCGTEKGITATQMDIKIDGLSYEILQQALEQAKRGREHIMIEMMKAIDKPRPNYKPHAPRIETMIIPKEMIGAVIGPGGKIIQEIQAKTNTTIAISEIDEKGYVEITAANENDMIAAKEKLYNIVRVPELNKVYKGKVVGITTFGAFIEIMPNYQGLLHISEIDWKRIKSVDEVLKEEMEIEVKLIDIEDKTGKLRLSRKALLPKPPKNEGDTKE
ncbi:MAG TPA: polyribonucleotide nucleotidyltransferase [Bacteroidales bacterium]|nr:polyribonucleotide nucleotidyltransferase [Bacteroidales bacterium]HOL99050.1 polyribonucleotide nucleotidyltransferase [Bacteroidales bacterium]HOM37441.1 polyribonucleotide nucleotidyltransferase [Bacteroidales bacterium]HPD24915.1 polyribonucleotide nucleotidyltransferase [Bacteroidales bacterium]HRT00620.1 polyribonucleotide nucleotidyltransferase [Bacteroidales bacterium]